MDYISVGESVPRKDAWEKASGAARYNSDRIQPGLLYGALVTSTCAHGLIKSIDLGAALTMPGVINIITGADFPVLSGPVLEDHPPLASGKVRYYGEPVAVVIAATEAQAVAAVGAVNIEYEALPIVTSPLDSFKPGAPLIHERVDLYKRMVSDVYPEKDTNIADHIKIRKGDLPKGWAASHTIIEAEYDLPQADHIAMETRNVQAEILPGDEVVIHSSSQTPFSIRKEISSCFGIDLGKITVHVPLVGGGFGGKAAVQLELIAYMASLSVGGRPIKISNTREQDISTSPSQLGLHAKIKLGADQSGRFTALEATFMVDSGAYCDIGSRMAKSMAMNCTGPYRIDNVWCDSYCIYTNHIYATSFRGFGHLEFTFALERSLDKLAAQMQLDPLELRRRNALKAGDSSPTQVALTTSNLGNLEACLDKLKSLINWDQGRYISIDAYTVRSKGISCLWKTSNSPTDAFSGAMVIINPDGSINLIVGAVEIGPGMLTTLAQILAEKMKMDINRIHVHMPVDTRVSPHHWKTVGSMTTYMVGKAVLEAAQDAINQLLSLAAMVLKVSPSDLDVARERVYLKDNPDYYIDIADIGHAYKYPDGNSVGGQVIGRGSFVMRHLTPLDPNTGRGRPGPAWTVGAQAVEVEYNRRDHSYKILKAVTVLDAGKVINPKHARGVITGGVSMGLGVATREEIIYDEQGQIGTSSLRTYKVLHCGQQPEYVVDYVETPLLDSPYGARPIGEHGIIGMPAALANSLSLAAGIELDQLPLTPELIWKRLEEEKR